MKNNNNNDNSKRLSLSLRLITTTTSYLSHSLREINALPPPTVTSVDRETHRVHERNNPKTSGRVLKTREREGRERRRGEETWYNGGKFRRWNKSRGITRATRVLLRFPLIHPSIHSHRSKVSRHLLKPCATVFVQTEIQRTRGSR